MYLSRLLLSHFKNIGEASLTFSPGINVLYGDNGEGKTNLLDGLYYLSVCKSSLGIPDRDVIGYQYQDTTLFGEYDMGNALTEKISCAVYRQGDKIFKRNGKRYDKLSSHVGLIPVVMVSPQDTSLVYGSGEERRKYLNFLLSQTEPDYLQTILEYKKLLHQRNKLLKSEHIPGDVMDALDNSLSVRADAIYNKRKELCRLLHPHVIHYYRLLSAGKEEIDLRYDSDLNHSDMAGLLKKNRQKDKMLQYTGTGIQRDDVQFSLEGHPLKVCGSQGQQKTYLLALKLAQFALIRQMKELSPILLLDDVFDKLDARRVSHLLHLVVEDGFGQIFLTDSNKVRIEELIHALGGPHTIYSVKEGVFKHEKTKD
jgi:DNA replication and repair protein RecF